MGVSGGGEGSERRKISLILRSTSEARGTLLLGSREAAEEECGRATWASSSPWTMATRSLRVRRLMSPQWGQSDPPRATSAWAQPRQKTHNSWPSESSIGSAQEGQSRDVIPTMFTGTQQGRRRVRCGV
ncbi:hypothetical protein ROHU_001217 [Labeo rohita]|uniref:Uncharacterized protein n=1 Tax=Labeo rohita TaxID=84645 RepID=A0A498P461_LABRO|nr:hypothetical protein ROHU_001217 [Labeo rohita]